MYNLHSLLWDIRKEPELAERFTSSPDAVLDEYAIDGDARTAMRNLDFKQLHRIGANPYLIYFCAIQLKVDRADYYAQIRKEDN